MEIKKTVGTRDTSKDPYLMVILGDGTRAEFYGIQEFEKYLAEGMSGDPEKDEQFINNLSVYRLTPGNTITYTYRMEVKFKP